MASVAFQVFTLMVFIALCADFFRNTARRRRPTLSDAAALDQDPALVALRGSRMFRGFLGALALTTLCVLCSRCYLKYVARYRTM